MENKNTSWKNLSRVERGKLISQTSQIVKISGGWRVPSQSDARLAYLVKFSKHKPECECPDCQIGRKKGCAILKKMYYMFLYKHDEFLEKYHKRSNAETVFHMPKTKFKDNLRSKSKTAQINELFCKILANNICVVIQEMNELKIRGEFIIEKK